jgi:hypothetical protein
MKTQRWPLLPPDEAKRRAALAARDCRSNSKRVGGLLARVWEGYESETGKPDPEEAENLLASVDAAAAAARELLAAMGYRRTVEKWERKAADYVE